MKWGERGRRPEGEKGKEKEERRYIKVDRRDHKSKDRSKFM